MIFRGYIPGRFSWKIMKYRLKFMILALKSPKIDEISLKYAQIDDFSPKFHENRWNLNLKKHQKIMKKRCFLHIFIIFWRYFIARFSMKFHKIWRIIWNLNLKKPRFLAKKWCFLIFIFIYFHELFHEIHHLSSNFIGYLWKIFHKIPRKTSKIWNILWFLSIKSDVFYKILWFWAEIIIKITPKNDEIYHFSKVFYDFSWVVYGSFFMKNHENTPKNTQKSLIFDKICWK